VAKERGPGVSRAPMKPEAAASERRHLNRPRSHVLRSQIFMDLPGPRPARAAPSRAVETTPNTSLRREAAAGEFPTGA